MVEWLLAPACSFLPEPGLASNRFRHVSTCARLSERGCSCCAGCRWKCPSHAGRWCEAGLEETLQREMLEETGWTLQEVRLLGLYALFPSCSQMPYGYRYSWILNFVQLIYMGEAGEYRSDASRGWRLRIDVRFHPLEQVHALPLSASQKMFLDAALQCR